MTKLSLLFLAVFTNVHTKGCHSFRGVGVEGGV